MGKYKYYREDEVHWDIILAFVVCMLLFVCIFTVAGVISDYAWYGHLRTQ